MLTPNAGIQLLYNFSACFFVLHELSPHACT